MPEGGSNAEVDLQHDFCKCHLRLNSSKVVAQRSSRYRGLPERCLIATSIACQQVVMLVIYIGDLQAFPFIITHSHLCNRPQIKCFGPKNVPIALAG